MWTIHQTVLLFGFYPWTSRVSVHWGKDVLLFFRTWNSKQKWRNLTATIGQEKSQIFKAVLQSRQQFFRHCHKHGFKENVTICDLSIDLCANSQNAWTIAWTVPSFPFLESCALLLSGAGTLIYIAFWPRAKKTRTIVLFANIGHEYLSNSIQWN